jgi:hypothetical protein
MVLCYPKKDNILGGIGVGPKKGDEYIPFFCFNMKPSSLRTNPSAWLRVNFVSEAI